MPEGCSRGALVRCASVSPVLRDMGLRTANEIAQGIGEAKGGSPQSEVEGWMKNREPTERSPAFC